METKAAGPDSGAARHLRCPPFVKARSLDGGPRPEWFSCGTGKTRPIFLLPMVWRAGAKARARRLKPWSGSWASCFDAGGLPRMSVSGAVQQLQLELKSGVSVASMS